MPNFVQKSVLIVLAYLLPIIGHAQTCQTGNIPASMPTGQFTDNSDGTVTDNKTGLMWKKCREGQTGGDCSGGVAYSYSWAGALERAQAVNTTEGGFAGYTDWRVPNIKELHSIVEKQCHSPAINLSVFPNVPAYVWFWSASPYAYDSRNAWTAYFENGSDYLSHKGNYGQVRLVRSGQ